MLHLEIDSALSEAEAWALRRQRGVPCNRRLWVLACMDERLSVKRALGIDEGDAHIFRNAGGLVTDDAIRSAMLTTQFFGTQEIIVITHTECGMMSATAEAITEALVAKGLDPETVPLDPALPELRLEPGAFARWLKTHTDVDEACLRQVELLRGHPFIPDEVEINGYVYEVESDRLRRPHVRLAEMVNTAEAMSRQAEVT